jgi:hypothetical protein
MKNPFYSALSILLRNTGRTLQILKYGLIENGWLRMTDLEHEIRLSVGDYGPDPVLVDIALLIKVDDLPAAIDAAQIMDVKDFPSPMDLGHQAITISPEILEGLVDLLPAVSTDDTRGCLKTVCVSRQRKEAVATDGHVLLLKKLDLVPKESFLIDAVSLKTIACLAKYPRGLSISHRAEIKDADGKVTTNAADFLTVSGHGWQLISKVLAVNEYPSYWKVMPSRTKATAVLWDKPLIKEVGAFLDKAKPFTNPRTRLIYLTAGEGVVKNSGISFFRKTTFARDILALGGEQVLGVNAEIMQTVLRFIGDRPVSVTVGNQMIDAVVFQGVDRLALLMPLRTMESGGSGITRSELMKDDKSKGGRMTEADDGEMLKKAA